MGLKKIETQYKWALNVPWVKGAEGTSGNVLYL